MKKWIVAGLCALLLLSAIPVFAADEVGLAGKSEIMASGSWVKLSTEGGSITLTTVGVTYGKFVNANTEAQLGLIYANAAEFADLKATILAPAVAYHFLPTSGNSATVPYLGAGLVYARVSESGVSETSTKLQYFAGVKFFIGGDYKTANKNVFLEYRRTNVEFGTMDATVNMVWAGISTVF